MRHRVYRVRSSVRCTEAERGMLRYCLDTVLVLPVRTRNGAFSAPQRGTVCLQSRSLNNPTKTPKEVHLQVGLSPRYRTDYVKLQQLPAYIDVNFA